MKNACKHLALCTLTLILCLALAACGSDDSGDYTDYGDDSNVPSTIDGFVKESYDSYDYSAFEGYYLPDSGKLIFGAIFVTLPKAQFHLMFTGWHILSIAI